MPLSVSMPARYSVPKGEKRRTVVSACKNAKILHPCQSQQYCLQGDRLDLYVGRVDCTVDHTPCQALCILSILIISLQLILITCCFDECMKDPAPQSPDTNMGKKGDQTKNSCWWSIKELNTPPTDFLLSYIR